MAFPQGSGQFINGVPQEPNVVGGSGREYFDPQTALDSEVSAVVLDTTAAGTTDGVIFTTIVVVADQFNGQEIVVTDLAAVNGGIAEHAQIVDTIAPDQLILDRPIDITPGMTYAIVDKKKVAVNASFEDAILSVTGDSEINLGGNVVKRINYTGTVRVGRVRNGRVLDGIFWTPGSVGVLILDGVEVSRREGTDDAVLMSPGVDAHGLEMFNSKAYGRVRGTTGRVRWILSNVTNPGVINAAGFNNAFSVVDAMAAAVTARNVLLSANRVDGSVALYHAEAAGSIVSAAPNFSDMRCFMGGDPTVVVDTSAPAKEVTVCQVDDTATLAVTILSPSYIESDIVIDHSVNLLGARASSGAASFTFDGDIRCVMGSGEFNAIKTQGACSGAKAVTVDGTLNCELTDATDFNGINLFGAFSGTATVAGAGTVNIKDAGGVFPFHFAASQVAGTTTYSPLTFCFDVGFIDNFHFDAGITVSAGTRNADHQLVAKNANRFHNTIPSLSEDETTVIGIVTGGTWNDTGDRDVTFGTAGDGVIRRARGGPSAAATLTSSGGARFWNGAHVFTQTGTSTTATATVVVSGETFYFGLACAGVAFAMIGAAILGVATVTGDVTYHDCNLATPGNVGGSATGGTLTVPSNFRVRDSNIAGAFILRFGGGAFAGSCSVFLIYVDFGGLVTIDGTNFPVWEATMCIFFGTPAALAFLTADPATLFFFKKCAFPYGTFIDTSSSLTLGKPVIADDDIVLVADSAIAAFRTVELTGTFEGQESDATTDNILGVARVGAAAAGSVDLIVHGWGFMQTDNSVVNVNEALEPANAGAINGAVQTASVKRIGYAVTATTGVGTETFYGRIHVDR